MFSKFLVSLAALFAAAPSTLAAPAPASISERDGCVSQIGADVYCGSSDGVPALVCLVTPLPLLHSMPNDIVAFEQQQ